MENNRFKSDEQSFLRLSQQREQNQRLKALFDDAVGEEEISQSESGAPSASGDRCVPSQEWAEPPAQIATRRCSYHR